MSGCLARRGLSYVSPHTKEWFWGYLYFFRLYIIRFAELWSTYTCRECSRVSSRWNARSDAFFHTSPWIYRGAEHVSLSLLEYLTSPAAFRLARVHL